MTMSIEAAEDLALRIINTWDTKISIVDWAEAIQPFEPANVERAIAGLITRRDWKLTTVAEFLSHVYDSRRTPTPPQSRWLSPQQHVGYYGHLATLIERRNAGQTDIHDELGNLARLRLRNPDPFIERLEAKAAAGDSAAETVLAWFLSLLCEIDAARHAAEPATNTSAA